MKIPWKPDAKIGAATKIISHGFEHFITNVPIGELYGGGECDVCKELGMEKKECSDESS